MFTYVLIALGALVAIAVVVHEVRSWRKPGHHRTGQNAPMDDGQVNDARHTNWTNVHNTNDFGGAPGSL
jgi:hypothetical protein